MEKCGGDKSAAWERAREDATRKLGDDIVANIDLEL